MSNSNSAVQVLPRVPMEQVPAFIQHCWNANIVPYVQGPPGYGKTAGGYAAAAKLGMHVILYVVPTKSPDTVAGFQVPTKTEDGVVTVTTMPALVHEVFKLIKEHGPDTPILILLDEMSAGDMLMKKAICSLIQENRIDQYKLPDSVRYMMTGNQFWHRAGVTPTPMQLINRASCIEVVPTFEGWANGYAYKTGMHALYLAAVSQFTETFFQTEMPSDPVPYSTARSVTFAHDLHMRFAGCADDPNSVPELPVDEVVGHAIAGLIGRPAQLVLWDYLKNGAFLPTRQEILDDPENATLPPEDRLGARHSATELLLSMVTAENMGPVWTYAERLGAEMATSLTMRVLDKDRDALNTPAFSKWAAEHADELVQIVS